jgi:general secretion pathway protein G
MGIRVKLRTLGADLVEGRRNAMLQRQYYQARARSGFTLMEIVVVVAIILILASAGIVVYTNMLISTREDRAKLDCHSLELAVGTYFSKHGVYPDSLQQLTQRQPDGSPALLEAKALNDPWGNAYVYEPRTRHQATDKPLIYSHGTPGVNKQINNWD